ncbi:MAG: hypothetical protein HPY54_14700 [Chthonomonadetes bacterium]|nr:hypothetical protein [Chthonomonadetes bacterium]
MWRVIVGIVWVTLLAVSFACGQDSWKEIDILLLRKESAFSTVRSEWQMEGGEQTIVVDPFDRGYAFSATLSSPPEIRQFVLIREQPYAYFCPMLGGVVVQHLTWMHGTKLLPYLAGLNLLRYVDKESPVQVTRKNDKVCLTGTLRKDFPPIVPGLSAREGIELVLDPAHDNAISEVQIFFGSRSQVIESLRVTEWQRRGNLWLPSVVQIEHKASKPLTLRLKSTRSASTQPPDWFRPPMWVSDWRLGITKDQVITYQFKDRLPGLDELESLRRQGKGVEQSLNVERHRLRGWGSALPPILLILVGALWHWRLKVKKLA